MPDGGGGVNAPLAGESIGGKVGAAGAGEAGAPIAGAGGGLVGTGGDAGDPCKPVGAAEPTQVYERNQYGFLLRDSYFVIPCTEALDEHLGAPGRACTLASPTRPCGEVVGSDADHSGAWVFSETFRVLGCQGGLYELDLRVSGIAEAKYYQGGQRRRGDDYTGAEGDEGTDTLYIGGEPIPSGHNVYKVIVYDADKSPLAHYYLNSFPEASGFEAPMTFAIHYDFTIVMPAGGYVEYVTKSDDCAAVDNCGPGVPVGSCSAPRVVPLEPGLGPPGSHGGVPVASQNVVSGAMQPFHSQLIHVTVTDIRVAGAGGEGGSGG